jgi:hypothetical protein
MTTPLFVYIIESPSPIDLFKGRTEGRTLSEALNLAGIPYYYSLVTNLKTWRMALGSKFQKATNKHSNLIPILHLSMHGSPDGIVLTNDTVILWDKLKQHLTPLYNKIGQGLLICMSSCFSAYGIKMAMDKTSNHPFYALVGSITSFSWQDAAVAYVTFYHLLFKDIPLEECVEGMRSASGNDQFGLWLGSKVKENWEEIAEEFYKNKRKSSK